jgi:hypothetical protein
VSKKLVGLKKSPQTLIGGMLDLSRPQEILLLRISKMGTFSFLI